MRLFGGTYVSTERRRVLVTQGEATRSHVLQADGAWTEEVLQGFHVSAEVVIVLIFAWVDKISTLLLLVDHAVRKYYHLFFFRQGNLRLELRKLLWLEQVVMEVICPPHR